MRTIPGSKEFSSEVFHMFFYMFHMCYKKASLSLSLPPSLPPSSLSLFLCMDLKGEEGEEVGRLADVCCWAAQLQVSAAASPPSLPPRSRACFLSGRIKALRWRQWQQLSAALQPCSPSPEHWPAGDNISKGVVIATHYIIIISDPSPFTPTAE